MELHLTMPSIDLPTHKNDFLSRYNLEDPNPYYAGLAPADYRMPDVLTGFISAAEDALREQRHRRGPVRILDFACGYGANAACLNYELRMHDLYTYYDQRSWVPADGDYHWRRDCDWFAAKSKPERRFHVAGLDIAPRAVDYGLATGLLDEGYTDDLLTGDITPGLRAGLTDVDLVIESGAFGAALKNAFECVLDFVPSESRPWFLYCPRPDVDWQPLWRFWSERGYRCEPCNREPVRYRKPLSGSERDEILRDGQALGLPAKRVIRDGYVCVDLMLARPVERGGVPMDVLRDHFDSIGK